MVWPVGVDTVTLNGTLPKTGWDGKPITGQIEFVTQDVTYMDASVYIPKTTIVVVLTGPSFSVELPVTSKGDPIDRTILVRERLDNAVGQRFNFNLDHSKGSVQLYSDMVWVPASKGSRTSGQSVSTMTQSFVKQGTNGLFIDVTAPPYKAAGDGTTNDTVAIQSAINAASAAGGGTVFFPRGTFVSSRLTMKSRVSLLGSNWLSSTLKLRTGSNADFIVLENVNTEQVGIRDLRINGNRAGNSSGHAVNIDNTAGVYSFSDPYHLFANVFVENSAGDAWKVSSGARECRFTNCHAKLAYGNGFNLSCTDSFFTDCTAATSGLAGWYIANGNNQFISCKAFSAGERMASTSDIGDGFYISYAPRNKFIGCEAQDNKRYGFVLIGNLCFSNMLIGCLADSNATYSSSTFAGFVLDSSAQRNHLTGCVSGNQRTTQDYGLLLQGGAFGNQIDMKIDSQGTAEHLYQGTTGEDNNLVINGSGSKDVTEAINVGQENFSRRFITSASVSSGVSGRMSLSYFKARKSETVSQIRMLAAGTASAMPTLVRIGIYSVAANGDLALIGSTANDLTMFAGTFAANTRSLTVPVALVAGKRYAIGMLILATTLPFVYGTSVSFGAEAVIAPRLGGTLSGLSDLPATATDTSLSATNAHLLAYTALLP